MKFIITYICYLCMISLTQGETAKELTFIVDPVPQERLMRNWSNIQKDINSEPLHGFLLREIFNEAEGYKDFQWTIHSAVESNEIRKSGGVANIKMPLGATDAHLLAARNILNLVIALTSIYEPKDVVDAIKNLTPKKKKETESIVIFDTLGQHYLDGKEVWGDSVLCNILNYNGIMTVILTGDPKAENPTYRAFVIQDKNYDRRNNRTSDHYYLGILKAFIEPTQKDPLLKDDLEKGLIKELPINDLTLMINNCIRQKKISAK